MGTRPVVIGLLGGVAAGKSTVAKLLAARGAVVVDADRLAHGVLARPDVADRVERLLGPGILDAEGRPDRSRIAERVFAEPGLLDGLEEILHPPVRERVRAEIAAAKQAPVVVLDAPLLLEGGLGSEVDVLVYVAAPARTRRRRAEKERDWEEGEVERREARQTPLEEKRRRADHVILNEGTMEELAAAVDDLWRRLRR